MCEVAVEVCDNCECVVSVFDYIISAADSLMSVCEARRESVEVVVNYLILWLQCLIM